MPTRHALPPHHKARQEGRRILAITELEATTQHKNIGLTRDKPVPIIRDRSGRDECYCDATAPGFIEAFADPAGGATLTKTSRTAHRVGELPRFPS